MGANATETMFNSPVVGKVLVRICKKSFYFTKFDVQKFFPGFQQALFFQSKSLSGITLAGRKFNWKVANLVCWIDFFEIRKCVIFCTV